MLQSIFLKTCAVPITKNSKIWGINQRNDFSSREVIYGKRVTWKSRGYFFHENPPNPIGDTQKYQKKLNFWSKTCFLWVFLELLQCYCYKLRKYTNFIFSPIQLIFVQFSLERTHLKGKDKWFLVPKVPEVSGQRKKNYGLENL